VNLFAKEQLTPEFRSINPQHCIPTISDGDFHLWESRGRLSSVELLIISVQVKILFSHFLPAIAWYLTETKSPGNTLLPSDPVERALVNQRLYFDGGTLYPRIRAIAVSTKPINCQ
jgi:glutathione S-transferase